MGNDGSIWGWLIDRVVGACRAVPLPGSLPPVSITHTHTHKTHTRTQATPCLQYIVRVTDEATLPREPERPEVILMIGGGGGGD